MGVKKPEKPGEVRRCSTAGESASGADGGFRIMTEGVKV
jgi:hypothetical protein